MVGRPLDVEQPVRLAVVEQLHQCHQRHLRRIASPVEHRLPGEQPADRDAVQPSGQFVAAPTPRPSARSPGRTAAGTPSRSGRRSTRPAARVRAPGHDLVVGLVERDRDTGVPTAASTGSPASPSSGKMPRRTGDHQLISSRSLSGIGKDALLVGAQDGRGLQVGADRDDVVVGLERIGEDPPVRADRSGLRPILEADSSPTCAGTRAAACRCAPRRHPGWSFVGVRVLLGLLGLELPRGTCGAARPRDLAGLFGINISSLSVRSDLVTLSPLNQSSCRGPAIGTTRDRLRDHRRAAYSWTPRASRAGEECHGQGEDGRQARRRRSC